MHAETTFTRKFPFLLLSHLDPQLLYQTTKLASRLQIRLGTGSIKSPNEPRRQFQINKEIAFVNG